MTLSTELVTDALSRIVDPQADESIVSLGVVNTVAVNGGHATITLDPKKSVALTREELGRAVRKAVTAVDALATVELKYADDLGGREIAPSDPLPGVKNIVLVMSGKGGVGKSTTATNLALALHRSGYRVGLLDADMYGPSIPTMFGLTGRPVSADGKSIEPLERFGIKVMSIGFLLEDPKAAVIWRGPMLAGALNQFLRDVRWGCLDYLLLDLPPGTGDIALTLSQSVKTTGAVVVTTPQTVATDDVFKSVSMCKKVNIRVLGVVENMSYFIDSAGVKHEIFGAGGGQAVAEFSGAPLLGQIPIDQSVREWGDKGMPVVQAAPAGAIARAFVEIAERLGDVIDSVHTSSGEGDAGPVIDRSGGTGRKRLPLVK